MLVLVFLGRIRGHAERRCTLAELAAIIQSTQGLSVVYLGRSGVTVVSASGNQHFEVLHLPDVHPLAPFGTPIGDAPFDTERLLVLLCGQLGPGAPLRCTADLTGGRGGL